VVVVDGQRHEVLADRVYEAVKAVAWSPDGQRIAGVSNGGAHLFVWDTAAPRPKFSVRVRKLASVAWSPAGDRFATGHTHQIINLWDPATGDVTRTLAGHIAARSLTFRTMPVAWSPDGRLLASGGVDRTARIWDV
jgi:WD40 repeat protein